MHGRRASTDGTATGPRARAGRETPGLDAEPEIERRRRCQVALRRRRLDDPTPRRSATVDEPPPPSPAAQGGGPMLAPRGPPQGERHVWPGGVVRGPVHGAIEKRRPSDPARENRMNTQLVVD